MVHYVWAWVVSGTGFGPFVFSVGERPAHMGFPLASLRVSGLGLFSFGNPRPVLLGSSVRLILINFVS
jgi:hypothetical protein